jgi:hypothetical protein
MNGIWDFYEPAIGGWTIELTGTLANGEPFGPIYAFTDENGFYRFGDLMPGVYVVREVIPEGWTHITPDRWEATIEEGSLVFCAKFGNVELGSIDGWKFLDWDMDWLKDGPEYGLEGWAITLEGWLNNGIPPWSYAGTYVGPITVYTDENGYWEFPDLLPGVYKVTEESRTGWHNTTPLSRTMIIGSGTDVFDVKFGNVPYTCIWGHKFNDLNGDGQWGIGEPAIEGWPIFVDGVDNNGTAVHIALQTDSDGMYATCYNLLPGTYVVSEGLSPDWEPTTASAYKITFEMSDENEAYRFDFGNFELGRISGYKYEDMDGSRDLSVGDTPISGWQIDLYLGLTLVATTYTDGTGYFEFSGLMAGLYSVVEVMQPGWVASSATSHEVLIQSGCDIGVPVFLNLRLGIIEGYKFEDTNGNGVWDGDEQGIPDWPIYLQYNEHPEPLLTYTDETGHYQFTDLWPEDFCMVYELLPPGWTATTSMYEVAEVQSGSHIWIHDIGNFMHAWITVFKYEDIYGDGQYDDGVDIPLEGWHITVSGPGIPGGSIVLVTSVDGYASVLVTMAGEYTATEEDRDGWCHTTPSVVPIMVSSGYADPGVAMFGNFECVDITIFKYEDVNSNGVYDEDIDWALYDWTFFLYSMNGGYMEVMTDIDGYAYVTFCKGDVWQIIEDIPDGWCPINPSQGYYSLEVKSGTAIELITMDEQYLYEFGNFRCVELRIFKFWDTCSNGWFDPGYDSPLGDWFFEVIGLDVEYYNYGWTDEDGYLSFTVCRAGNYSVIEESVDGWSPIYPLGGYSVVWVQSGDGVIILDFANYLMVDVPIFKYEDFDGDGVYDQGYDQPLEGWYFELTRHGDGYVYSGYTDADGMLVLSVDRSGTYTLAEEDRPGWTHTEPLSGEYLLSITSGVDPGLQMFGNFQDVTIEVFKFDDLYGDGQCGHEDVALEGWSFTVFGPGLPAEGVVITTNEFGYAYLTVHTGGTYTVDENVQ